VSARGITRRALLAGGEPLERLLGFEQRLESAYRAALEREAIDPELGEALLTHEGEHVRGVESALRTLGSGRPRASVTPPEQGRALSDRAAFARFAIGLERDTVSAYAEVLATLRAPELLQPLGSIMTAGAQHEVALRQVLGDELLNR
jgi:hypothetical protein